MARGSTITTENNFTQGLVTEFTAMNFPENAVTAGDNVVFSELGVVSRRSGIDREEDGVIHNLSALSPSSDVFVEFKWEAVGGQGTRSFLVQQIGSRIRFFEIGGTSVSNSLKSFQVNLLNYKTSVDDLTIQSNPCQFTFGKGYLFVVHPFCSPLSVEYSDVTDTITTTRIELRVRDFERLDDGTTALDQRPPTLTNTHRYNLHNQGWYLTARCSTDQNEDEGVPQNVLAFWDSVRSDFPSNSDVWWVYKNQNEIFVNQNIDKYAVGNTPAPSGHFIYPAWNINRTSVSGISNLPTTTAGNARPSCTAFYAGRIFYAGISASKYSDKIYFSQIVESDDQFGKCYQANDPTSETAFDLLTADGGVISLPLVSKVISLQVIGDALVVIGTNGVFTIRGTANGPFSAVDYTVEYISEIGGVSHLSIINVDGSLLWWNYDALYALSKDQSGLSYTVQNLSKTTIQSVIDAVPPANRSYIKGAYNKKERKVQWVYSDDADAIPFRYNRTLEFNVISKAFYTNTISFELAPRIVGLISVSGQRRTTVQANVTTSTGAIVTDDLLNNVFINEETFTPNIEAFKYATSGAIGTSGVPGFTYSDPVSEHIDWGSFGGLTFQSFFESGYRIRGEMLRSFNSTPIALVVQNIPDAEVIFKGIWDYGFRQSMPQTIYDLLRKVDLARGWQRGDYLIRRLKPRGKGKSFQLRFDSVQNAPFGIVGWSTFDTGGQQP